VAGNGKNEPYGQPILHQSFVSTPAATTALPMLSGASACGLSFQGKAINDLGVVVGNCDVGPWIWDSVNLKTAVSR